MASGHSGWDKTPAIDWSTLLESLGAELRIAADETTPQSANNQSPDAVQQRQASLRPEGGTLIRSHRFRVLTGQKAVQWTNKKPYAAIQDVGGYIPPLDVSGRKGKYLKGGRRTAYGTRGGSGVMLAYIGGGWRFFTKRKGFTLPGQNYTGRAIDIAIPKLKVKWAETGAEVVRR